MQYFKVYCQEHSYEPITNFCVDPQCLVGLCATCICDHTRNHMQRGTPPCYENVRNTYTRFNERMRDQIDTIEQDKVWLSNVFHNIEEKKQNVKATLVKVREDCIATVNRHFDELETKINSEIMNQTKRNSLHSSYRLETLNTLMLKEISNLLMYSNDLSSSKFLETAKIVEEEVFPNSREFHMKICKELKENEVYSANAVYKEEMLGDLTFSLKRLVNLEFLLPRVEFVEGPPAKVERADQFDDHRRSASLRKNNSMMVMPRATDTSSSRVSRNIGPITPKHNASVIISTNPLAALQQFVSRSQLASPTLQKGSRLSSHPSDLKIIRETKRENTNQNHSMTTSSVSCTNKENDLLAQSKFIDTSSSFWR